MLAIEAGLADTWAERADALTVAIAEEERARNRKLSVYWQKWRLGIYEDYTQGGFKWFGNKSISFPSYSLHRPFQKKGGYKNSTNDNGG